MSTSKGQTPKLATRRNRFHSDLSTKQLCISHAKKIQLQISSTNPRLTDQATTQHKKVAKHNKEIIFIKFMFVILQLLHCKNFGILRINTAGKKQILIKEDSFDIMARITVEDCLKQIGNENRFVLIHLAVARVKQHRKGQDLLVKGKNKEVVMTLREIAAGEVTFDNIKDLTHQESEPETTESEQPAALTQPENQPSTPESPA